MTHKYVYLIGNKDIGVLAFSYDKSLAKKFMKQRCKYSKLNNHSAIKKVNMNDKIKSYLLDSSEILNHTVLTDTNLLLTESEEEYIIESFSNFIDSVIRNIKSFNKIIKYINFTKEEEIEIKKFIKFLNKIDKISTNINNDKYDDDDTDIFKLFDMNKIIKYAIKYIL